MAESKAAKVGGWSSRKQRHEAEDLKGAGLPQHVQDAILDVEARSWDIHENVQLAEEIFSVNPDHDMALEPGKHRQTSWAQRFEEVDGEIVSITKESAESPVKVEYRPELRGYDKVDPVSALEAKFQVPLSEDEKGSSQREAEELAQTQVRED